MLLYSPSPIALTCLLPATIPDSIPNQVPDSHFPISLQHPVPSSPFLLEQLLLWLPFWVIWPPVFSTLWVAEPVGDKPHHLHFPSRAYDILWCIRCTWWACSRVRVVVVFPFLCFSIPPITCTLPDCKYGCLTLALLTCHWCQMSFSGLYSSALSSERWHLVISLVCKVRQTRFEHHCFCKSHVLLLLHFTTLKRKKQLP